MDMRALYYVILPSARLENEDQQSRDEDIKANENCLNQNFALLADKIYEFEARLASIEAALSRAGDGFGQNAE